MMRLNFGKEFVNLIHPIGSTVFNRNKDFDPNKLWIGTTWENLGCCVLMGCDPKDKKYSQPGTYVGENEHLLTEAELPYISGDFNFHGAGSATVGQGCSGHFRPNTQRNNYRSGGSDLGGAPSYDGFTFSLGSDQPHNNVQRSYLGYWWIRTS